MTSSAEASRVLEEYLLESANAVVNVANNVENMANIIPQDAQVMSAVLLGTPKPSASDVVSLVNFKRRKVTKDELPSDILDAVSVSRFSQELHIRRAENAMMQICGHISRLSVPGKTSTSSSMALGGVYSCGEAGRRSLNKMREKNSIGIGLSLNGEPVLDKGKYETGSTAAIASPTEEIEVADVEATLIDMLDSLNINPSDLKNVVELTKRTNAYNLALKWSKSVEHQLDPSIAHSSENTLTEMYMPNAMEGIHDMYRIFRDSFLHIASQLTKIEDIDAVQIGMKNCMSLISSNALERAITAILFYSCFKVTNTTKELVGIEGGTVKKTKIERRKVNDIYVSLCFFFQSFHVSYADALYGLNDLINHRSYAEGYIRSLLTGYSYDSDGSWAAFNQVLDKRREILRRDSGLREDVLDCRVNLSGPMYVVICDALHAVREIVESSENFLQGVHNKQILLNKYFDGRTPK
ncbi:hypothetical protein Pcinc_011780 [Petrolisthes cinctipes]|uniref:Uncharacterized protein n=1 Tax=Petrolisthes cinctipes TaxID=88211 RepID=A0AAE1G260_PETCI|nr:hypothetical protein Pcinc_011780 [Petrolisthes cinctipes]